MARSSATPGSNKVSSWVRMPPGRRLRTGGAGSGGWCAGDMSVGNGLEHVAEPANRDDAHVAARELAPQAMKHLLDGVGPGVAGVGKHLAIELGLGDWCPCAHQQRRERRVF